MSLCVSASVSVCALRVRMCARACVCVCMRRMGACVYACLKQVRVLVFLVLFACLLSFFEPNIAFHPQVCMLHVVHLGVCVHVKAGSGCPKGHFSPWHAKCRPCRPCADTKVIRPCTATQDRVCAADVLQTKVRHFRKFRFF